MSLFKKKDTRHSSEPLPEAAAVSEPGSVLAEPELRATREAVSVKKPASEKNRFITKDRDGMLHKKTSFKQIKTPREKMMKKLGIKEE